MPKSRLVVIFSLVFLLANIIKLVYFSSQPIFDFIYDKNYQFSAQVRQVDKKINNWQVYLAPSDLANYQGLVLTYVPLYPEPQTNDLWQVKCRLDKPEAFAANNRIFYYDQYLAKDKIFAICAWPKIQVIGHQHNWTDYLYKLKNYLWQNLNDYLVEPASSLSKALLLSSRREVPASINQIFARVGLSHIIAISGMHMVILAALLETLLIGLGFSRQQGVGLVLLFLLLYLFLTGFPGSGVRATVMMALILLGRFLGRHSSPFYVLLLSAVFLVILNPATMLYDIGWQLSCLAVLGLLCYSKFLENKLRLLPNIFKLREVLAVTLAAQVFTTPLILYYFGTFSVVAPLANFLILPISTAILVLAILLGIFGFWSILAAPLAWLLYLMMKAMVLIAQYLGNLPYAYLQINYFPLSYLVVSLLIVSIITAVLKPYRYEAD